MRGKALQRSRLVSGRGKDLPINYRVDFVAAQLTHSVLKSCTADLGASFPWMTSTGVGKQSSSEMLVEEKRQVKSTPRHQQTRRPVGKNGRAEMLETQTVGSLVDLDETLTSTILVCNLRG